MSIRCRACNSVCKCWFCWFGWRRWHQRVFGVAVLFYTGGVCWYILLKNVELPFLVALSTLFPLCYVNVSFCSKCSLKSFKCFVQAIFFSWSKMCLILFISLLVIVSSFVSSTLILIFQVVGHSVLLSKCHCSFVFCRLEGLLCFRPYLFLWKLLLLLLKYYYSVACVVWAFSLLCSGSLPFSPGTVRFFATTKIFAIAVGKIVRFSV